MLRSFSQIFNGSVVDEKGGKEMAGPPMDEASTAPGSSAGEEASEAADGTSDMSTEEESPPPHVDGETPVGGAQPGTESENAEVPEDPVCAQAAVAGARVAEDWPTCVDTTERRKIQIEESGNGERGEEFTVASATVDDAAVARGSPVRRPTPVSQTGDGQARRRALKRYKLYESGQFVKGRPGDGGRWLAEPGAAAFRTLESAMEHERHKTMLRRASWANLKGEVAGTRKAVTEEGAQTRLHQSKEAEETRRSVDEARDDLAAKLEEGVKILCAQKRENTLDSSSASKIAFYSMVFSNLRAQDMKDLLMSRDIEPVGAKSMLAQLVVAHLTQEEVEQFVIIRSGKRRRVDVPSGGQRTLDVLFNAETRRVA